MKTKKIILSMVCAIAAAAAFALGACDERAHVHELTHVDGKSPTCIAVGNIEYWHCDGCDKDFVDALGETETDDVTLEATGVHTGGEATHVDRAVCAECGEPYGETVPHAFLRENASDAYLKTDATCTAAAVYYKSCECGAFDADGDTFVYGEPIAHTYDRAATDSTYLKTDATCTAAAVYYKSCECGAFDADGETFVYGECLGHDFTGEPLSDGDAHWNVCMRDGCDAESERAPHNFGDWIIDRGASCTVDGARHRVCGECNKIENGVIDAVGHKYGFWYTNLKSDYEIGESFTAHNGYYDWYDPTEPVMLVIHYWCENANDVNGVAQSYEIADSAPFDSAGAHKVRFTADCGGEIATGEIDVTVYEQIAVVEGESAQTLGFTGDGNYIVKSAENACKSANASSAPTSKWYQPGVYENTSGKGWMNEIQGGSYIELHISSDTARKAKIVMRAASFLVTEKAQSDEWQGSAGMQTSKTNPAKLEQAITVTYDGGTIEQSGVLAGVSSSDGKGHLWCSCYWTDVVIAEIELEAGDNVLRIDFNKYNLVNNNSCAIQIDAFTVMYGEAING